MRLYSDGKELEKDLQSFKGTLAFVPTMGALHRGHIQLVQHAGALCDRVAASVFVNPTQFDNPDDLLHYPRDIEGDKEKLAAAGCDYLWIPTVEDIYPDGTQADHYDLHPMDSVMEGQFRPGHFQGVATIVDRLFKTVRPDVAVFGEKDFQQVAIIRRMLELRQHDVEIEVLPTVRESDGLAMSSRNIRLDIANRQSAPAIYRAMQWVHQNKATTDPASAVQRATEIVQEAGLKVEYIEIADENSLRKINAWSDSAHVRIFIAAYVGAVRLIDNMSLI